MRGKWEGKGEVLGVRRRGGGDFKEQGKETRERPGGEEGRGERGEGRMWGGEREKKKKDWERKRKRECGWRRVREKRWMKERGKGTGRDMVTK